MVYANDAFREVHAELPALGCRWCSLHSQPDSPATSCTCAWSPSLAAAWGPVPDASPPSTWPSSVPHALPLVPVQAALMPRLLLGSSPAGADGQDAAAPGGGPVDFWQLFAHVTGGNESNYNVRNERGTAMH